MSAAFLCYLDEPLLLSDDVHPTATFFGGNEVLPDALFDHFVLPHCLDCAIPLQLVLQAYAPVDIRQDFHRIILLYFCDQCASPDSWKCLRLLEYIEDTNPRAKKKKKQKAKIEKKEKMVKSNLFDLSDEWGTPSWDEEPSDNLKETTTNDDVEELLRLRDLSITEKKTAKKQQKEKPAKALKQEKIQRARDSSMEVAWISIGEEPAARSQPKEKLKNIPAADPEWKGEKYERCTVFTKKFSKFIKYLERAPEQIVRYSFSGSPLWATDRTPIPSIPTCDCGQPRTFELQIMPHGLNWIKDKLAKTQTAKIELIGIGSVFIFSCPACCTRKDISKEIVVMQPTEDSVSGPLRSKGK